MFMCLKVSYFSYFKVYINYAYYSKFQLKNWFYKFNYCSIFITELF